MFRFENTHVELRHDLAHQDAPAAEALDWARKGAGQIGIFVKDVDAVRAELEERGVTMISSPTDRDWGMRTITFADPGYVWEIRARHA